MFSKAKIFIGILISFILFGIFFTIYSYYVLHKTLPDYEGNFEVNGIKNEIEIYRDSLGIPYIFSKSDEDAAFALGYVHAQERLFQMDLMRRAGEGRLSEVLGPKTVTFDKLFRTVGIFNHVKENLNNYNPLTLKFLKAYSKGVNEFINNSKGNLPIEFDLLGYEPYKWEPEHSLVIAKLLAWELNISWWTDIAFVHLIQKLGEEKVKEILPDYPENAPYIIPSEIKNFAAVTTDFMNTDKQFREFMGMTGTHIGSNNWVVNGKRSNTGKPIIANDPHLAFQAPGKWYFAVIKSNNWNVEGFTLPGAPVVVIGKNQNISWVLTNVMADDCDFYSEQFDSSKQNYMFNGNWKPLSFSRDTIFVKDSADVELEIVKTHRGPVITDINPANVLFPNEYQNKVKLSMRWTALEFSDEFFGLISVNKSKNWNEFKDAVKNFTVPGQNFVYGDKDGNIGYIAAAKLPIRNSQSPSLIFDGTTDTYDWKGFVPYEQMPKLFNPSENYIASANNKTVKNFPYHISNLWEPPSRIERIKELLDSKSVHSKEDFKKYQNDFYSKHAEDIVPFILSAFENVKIKDKNLKSSLTLLENWNFVMNKFSQSPAVFLTFYQKLLENIFKDEMGEQLFNEYIFMANVPYRTVYKLLRENNSTWFDDLTTEQYETRDDIIRNSFADALTELENKFGKNIAAWQWGKLHNVTFKHFFHGQLGIIDKLVDVGPYEISGDGTTVFNTEYSFTKPFETKLGPSMRYIYDFSNPDIIELAMPVGQSGYFLSEHYDDMTEDYLNGKYYKININEEKIKNSGMKLLTLTPVSK